MSILKGEFREVVHCGVSHFLNRENSVAQFESWEDVGRGTSGAMSGHRTCRGVPITQDELDTHYRALKKHTSLTKAKIGSGKVLFKDLREPIVVEYQGKVYMAAPFVPDTSVPDTPATWLPKPPSVAPPLTPKELLTRARELGKDAYGYGFGMHTHTQDLTLSVLCHNPEQEPSLVVKMIEAWKKGWQAEQKATAPKPVKQLMRTKNFGSTCPVCGSKNIKYVDTTSSKAGTGRKDTSLCGDCGWLAGFDGIIELEPVPTPTAKPKKSVKEAPLSKYHEAKKLHRSSWGLLPKNSLDRLLKAKFILEHELGETDSELYRENERLIANYKRKLGLGTPTPSVPVILTPAPAAASDMASVPVRLGGGGIPPIPGMGAAVAPKPKRKTAAKPAAKAAKKAAAPKPKSKAKNGKTATGITLTAAQKKRLAAKGSITIKRDGKFVTVRG